MSITVPEADEVQSLLLSCEGRGVIINRTQLSITHMQRLNAAELTL